MSQDPRSAVALVIALGLAAPACVEESGDRACDGRAQARAALTLPERALVGEAAPYLADPTLQADEALYAASPRARRALGWRTIARVIDPVAIVADVPASEAPTLPRFRTWYDAADVARVFRALYLGLPEAARARRDRFAAADVTAAIAWNTHAVDASVGWPVERLEAFRQALDTPDKLAGLGGLTRTALAPRAFTHLLGSYPEIAACAAGVPPEAAGERRASTEELVLGACEARPVGPWALADGATATLRVDGADALLVLGPDGLPACDVGPGEPCDVLGPGAFRGVVTGAADGGVATLALDLPPAPGCLADAFPGDAAVVKASWHRADLGRTLPAYDTSPAGLARTLAAGATWPPAGDVVADPGPDEILTAELADGRRYRLAALHVMTRELGHWLWATIWWSPTPDEDFGADRPASFGGGGVWGSYKMCVVTAFDEGGRGGSPGAAGRGGEAPLTDAAAGLDDVPSLAAALRVVTDGSPRTWCSNPYLEAGLGNAGSSCLGCHQDAATGVTSEHILALPDRGREQRRDAFPTDYLWAITAGDRFGSDFANVIAWDDAAR